jgi:hypothetical protein
MSDAPAPTQTPTPRAPFLRALLGAAALSAVVIGASACNGGAANDDGDGGDAANRCVAPPGTNASPRSVADVVALLNALPAPVTLPCFLETLARPLKMHATLSQISLQPSAGARSPRVFLFSDTLRMSVALAGTGSSLLEFGEINDQLHSIKAEIGFPVTAPLTPESPFERVLFTPTQTRCSFCHPSEEPIDIGVMPAFTSVALRPSPGNGVSIDFLRYQRDACDPTVEPDRCPLLHGLFDQGLPIEQAFPDDLALIQ